MSSSLSEVVPCRESENLSQWMPKVPASSFESLLMNEYEQVIGIRSSDHFVLIVALIGQSSSPIWISSSIVRVPDWLKLLQLAARRCFSAKRHSKPTRAPDWSSSTPRSSPRATLSPSLFVSSMRTSVLKAGKNQPATNLNRSSPGLRESALAT